MFTAGTDTAFSDQVIIQQYKYPYNRIYVPDYVISAQWKQCMKFTPCENCWRGSIYAYTEFLMLQHYSQKEVIEFSHSMTL